MLTIFTQMTTSRFGSLDIMNPEGIIEKLMKTMIDIYQQLEGIKKTPSQCYYQWNIQDLGRLQLGLRQVLSIMQCDGSLIKSKDQFLQIFAHELYRSLTDRLDSPAL